MVGGQLQRDVLGGLLGTSGPLPSCQAAGGLPSASSPVPRTPVFLLFLIVLFLVIVAVLVAVLLGSRGPLGRGQAGLQG